MNFAITWIFDKLGYMPKIDMEIGQVKIDTKSPDFRMFPFPVEKPRPQVKKATTRKSVAKKTTTVAKKATKKAK